MKFKPLILTLLLLPKLCFATITETKDSFSKQYEIVNEAVTTSNYIKLDISEVGNYQSIRFTETQSTANLSFLNSKGTAVESMTIYKGTTYPTRGYARIALKIINHSGSPRNMNGIVTLSNSPVPKRVKSLIAITAGTTSTTVTVTQATQGFWFFRSDQKIHVDFAGGTATTSDFYLKQDDSIDTGVYLYSGDVIKMIAATTTASVTGYVYE